MNRVQFGSRKVMNAKLAGRDDRKDFVDANLASVIDLQRTSGAKAAMDDGEDDGSK